jgi:hypothetical protein
MGKLRQIGRKIDKGIRKVFGKDGWLKAAATVAALWFAAPMIGKAIGQVGKTAVTTGKEIVKDVATDSVIRTATAPEGGEAVTPETIKAAAYASVVDSVAALANRSGDPETLEAPVAPEAPEAPEDYTSIGDSVKMFFMGDPDDKKNNPGLLANTYDFATDTVSGAIKGSITKAAMGGDTDDFGRTKGVQQISPSEQSAIQSGIENYSMNYPNNLPTITVPQVQPVFARLT